MKYKKKKKKNWFQRNRNREKGERKIVEKEIVNMNKFVEKNWKRKLEFKDIFVDKNLNYRRQNEVEEKKRKN